MLKSVGFINCWIDSAYKRWKMIRGRKGTERPVEIFIALFVILAVSLVMLKLYQNELQNPEPVESKPISNVAQVADHCSNYCQQATTDSCSLRSMAQLCISYANDATAGSFIDLNGNGVSDTDTSLLIGLSVCEDAVPCHAFVDECCGVVLNGATCVQVLEDYWSSQGFSDMQTLFAQNINPGTCSDATSQSATHWYFYEHSDGSSYYQSAQVN